MMASGSESVERDQRLASCAHDLRGALTVIAGYVELLRRDDLSDADRGRALSGIDAAIQRADSLVGEMLSGRERRAGREVVNLVELAEAAASDARATTGREIIVRTEGSPTAVGDAIAVARVLENLLGNAAKYAPEGPIELTVDTRGDQTCIEVADHGPGIPAAERERVLEPFARLERDAASAPGTGLGLTVVRSIAEAMRGRIEIDDNAGGGAVFRVLLPNR